MIFGITGSGTFQIATSNKRCNTQSDWITSLGKHASGTIVHWHAGKDYTRKLSWIDPGNPWAGYTWICIHHSLKDITILSSVTSNEGYNHSIIFTDSNSGLRWQYGMKTKDETQVEKLVC
jgi:hypothetical protein